MYGKTNRSPQHTWWMNLWKVSAAFFKLNGICINSVRKVLLLHTWECPRVLPESGSRSLQDLSWKIGSSVPSARQGLAGKGVGIYQAQ